jgi:hypothetical protein
MRALVPALAAALVSVAVPAAAKPRPGRIVRVERPRTGTKGALRMCQYNNHDTSAICFGLAPQAGEIGTVLRTRDSSGVAILGRVRVKRVEATNPGQSGPSTCSTGMWRAELEVVQDLTTDPYGSWLVFDAGLGPGAQLVDAPPELPGKHDNEQAAMTIDRDGDGTPEAMVTWYPEDGDNAASASPRYLADYWEGGPARWHRVRQDRIAWCM